MIRKTKLQSAAFKKYQFAEQQEDRLLGSVFVNSHNQRIAEAKTKEAYNACKALGMTHEHGL